MPRVLFRHISDLSVGAGAPDQRVGLAGRATDQDRVVKVLSQAGDNAVDCFGGGLSTQFKAA